MARKYDKKRSADRQLMLDNGGTGLYIRVSTEKQATEGFSLDDQVKRLKAYCEAHGWPVSDDHIYIDAGVSGKSTEARKEFNRMRRDAESKQLTRIVAIKLDRLARNVKDFLYLVDELKSWGCDLVLIKESFDTATPHGKFALTMFAAMAELEIATIRERLDAGRREKAHQGGYNGSRCPLGYVYAKGEFEATDRAGTVINIFNWLNNGLSLNAIVRRLVASGVPTATGKGNWTVRGVKHILANGAYAGIVQWNDIEADGVYPPILSRSTYEEAQDRLRRMKHGQRTDLTKVEEA